MTITTNDHRAQAAGALERNQVVQGECLEVLRQLPEASFDAIVTDPPYCSGGTSSASRTGRSAASKYVSSDSAHGHALPDFGGDERDQRSFTLWCERWLTEALRVVRPGGTALVFTDWRQLPALSDALQIAGWRWRGIVVWAKRGARPQRGFANDAEYVLWGSHGAPDPDHVPPFLPGVYSISAPRGSKRKHITAKPVDLMRYLLRATPAGGRVLDPFAGSGTTGVAAVAEGRRFLGVERSAAYVEIASARLAEAHDALGLALGIEHGPNAGLGASPPAR
ncbi:DNA-methyltransferase [Mycobacterium talmoniae]|uniref:Methyltransferase n=1 Tax=Mycobacterium talmoniae TaxID=1858794 RepID=A0A1S1NKK4_9MYCO|nr:site-specific DNA-methyltransferase [Mycobacterium talmoniae]OHV03714.1 DNA methylase [Mycobacterium talmoniae]